MDPFTVHGGCPVLVGSKWITNKWVRWKAQELSLPAEPGWRRHPPLHSPRHTQAPALALLTAHPSITYTESPLRPPYKISEYSPIGKQCSVQLGSVHQPPD